MSAPALWTASEAAAATGGAAAGKWRAKGVSIDSRSLAVGDLFVAIKGPSHDGHDHVPAALKDGAAAAMVSRPVAKLPNNAPLLTVADTLDGLAALGRKARERSQARIVAVTGSVGKTGTKEALRLVLGGQGETSASQSSFNNHWGVPLSLSRLPRKARFGIFEIGMNHPGEITPLSQMVRPEVAVITTVEAAHTEFFKSLDDIADAKAEIFAGMTPDGVAVLNRDNAYFDRLAAHARAAGIKRIVGFGIHADAVVRAVSSSAAPGGTEVDADINGRAIKYVVGAAGPHWVMNSLAVLAATEALGADLEQAAADLAGLQLMDGRGRSHRLTLATGEFMLIDESYNANPASMRATIATLGETATGPGGRRIAVLGDMRELGPRSAEMHAELAAVLAARGIDLVFAAGAEMKHLMAALPESLRAGYAESGADLVARITDALLPGDVLMVKGSNASGMGAVVAALLARSEETTQLVNA